MDRRNFIKSVATVTGVSVVNPSFSFESNPVHHTLKEKGKKFDPSKEPLRVRKSFYDLTDEELKTFMRAVGYMRNNLKLEDPTQWDNYAKIHALHCTEASDEHPPVHWSWNFLPWHRGYLYFLERILAECLDKQGYDGSKFALPYWDWVSHKKMPNTKERESKGLPSPFFGYDRTLENMVSDDGLGFDNSALYDGNRGPTLEKPEIDPRNELTQDSKDHVTETLGYFSPQYINLMLSTPWEQFLGSPVTDRSTGQGLLEQGPHNDGHDWVGSRFGKNRTMGTLRTAAGDPMFYMHHGNIDRIWSLYKKQQPDPTGDWGKQEYNFLDIDGSIITMSVQEIIQDLNNVSYEKSKIKLLDNYVSSSVPSKFILTQKVIDSSEVDVDIPADIFSGKPINLQITTGTISYTGKYTVKIFAGDKFVGKISFLDGEHREFYELKNVSHKFNVLLTNVPKGITKLRFVPPKRGNIKISINSMEFKEL